QRNTAERLKDATEGRSVSPHCGVAALGRCTTSTCEPRLPMGADRSVKRSSIDEKGSNGHNG
ncbi:MAG: hypothetical protein VCF08_22105, partial [Alphaproteobacteria bacterium]